MIDAFGLDSCVFVQTSLCLVQACKDEAGAASTTKAVTMFEAIRKLLGSTSEQQLHAESMSRPMATSRPGLGLGNLCYQLAEQGHSGPIPHL
jgi:hypothetical protein